MSGKGHISLRGVSVHNLKSVDLDIPRGKLVVFCGLSGSGKSEPGVRYALCRRATAVHRELFGLYAAVSRPAGKARCRADRRPAAGHRGYRRRRQSVEPRDRRHGDRSGRLPAAAVRQDRQSVLPQVRPRGQARDAAERRGGVGRTARRHAVYGGVCGGCERRWIVRRDGRGIARAGFCPGDCRRAGGEFG